jgi:hypothetical protein
MIGKRGRGSTGSAARWDRDGQLGHYKKPEEQSSSHQLGYPISVLGRGNRVLSL